MRKMKLPACAGGEVMEKPDLKDHLQHWEEKSLQPALELYAGTVILVSHDRQFVSALATQVLELGGGQPVHFDGNYEDYLGSRGLA